MFHLIKVYCLSIFIILCWANLSFAQVQVQGYLQEKESQEGIFYANVLLKSKVDSQLVLKEYTFTDTAGYFVFPEVALGNYVVEARFVGKRTQSQEITISDTSNSAIELLFLMEAISLEEVVVEAQGSDVQRSGDSLIYRIEGFTDGSEIDLEDVLQKLPGLRVDEEGSFYYRGEKIDHLLVNGTPFFKGQHAIAGKSITAEMLDKIAVIENYQVNSSDVNLQDNTDEIAMDISIKKEYLNQWVGQVEAGGGYQNAYQGRVNLLNIRDKWKIGFTASGNTIGQPLLSSQDYLSMKGGLLKVLQNEGVASGKTQIELPENLQVNSQAEAWNGYLNILNFGYNSPDKLDILGYALFHWNQQNSDYERRVEQVTTGFTFNNQRISEEDMYLGLAGLDLNWSISKKQRLSYQVTSELQQNSTQNDVLDISESQMLGNSQIQNRYNRDKIDLQQNLEHKILVAPKQTLTTRIQHQYYERENTMDIFSDIPLLGLTWQGNQIEQQRTITFQKWGSNIAYDRKFKPFTSTVQIGYQEQNNFSKVQNLGFETENVIANRQFSQRSTQLSFKINSNKGEGKLRYQGQVALQNIELAYEEQNKQQIIIPFQLGLFYDFAPTHFIGLNYQQGYNYNPIEEVDSLLVLTEYDTRTIGTADWQQLAFSEKWNLNYFFFDLISNTIIFLNANYQRQNQATSLNSVVSDTYFTRENIQNPNIQEFLTLTLNTQTQPKKSPFAITCNSIFTRNQITQFTFSESKLVTQQFWENELSMSSRFSIPLNITWGGKYMHQLISDKDTQNRMEAWRWHLALQYKDKNFQAEISSSYQQNNSLGISDDWVNLNGSLLWKIPNSKFQVGAKGYNLLNLTNNQFQNFNIQNDYTERIRFSQLPGNILGYVRFSF